MSKLRRTSRPRYDSAAEWPASHEIDGHSWELGPSENPDQPDDDETPPDEYWNALRDESEAMDRLERGWPL